MFVLLRHVLIRVCCKVEPSGNVLCDPSGFIVCNAVMECTHLTLSNIFFCLNFVVAPCTIYINYFDK